MLKVSYGQDPYSVIGKYIRDHITAIEDIIAVIEIDDITTTQLFMVDMDEENYFIWNNDWYEGEKDVALIDFFPVSEAINPSAQPEITDKQAIEHLQESGWMQNHDKQMYEMGLREKLADDSDSYNALLPSAQTEIIRCKDCKYAEVADKEDNQDGYTCQFHRGSIWFSGSFCSWAERRKE